MTNKVKKENQPSKPLKLSRKQKRIPKTAIYVTDKKCANKNIWRIKAQGRPLKKENKMENFENSDNAEMNFELNNKLFENPTASENPNFDQGIPLAQIPSGDEDLYILKSQIVPPVCPKCPTYEGCPKEKKCTPCPPCARCPEPAFECKKVPNYNPTNEWLPGLDFSQFSNLKTY